MISALNDEIMQQIGNQLRRAQEREYLVELTENQSYITATFNQNIHNFTIESVIKHISIKYGEHVWVSRNELDPTKIEIWNKKISF